AWATWLVPARRKIGFALGTAKESIAVLALDERVEVRARHVADRALALVSHLTGASRPPRTPDVAHLVAAGMRGDVAAWLDARRGRPYALLQPFSSAAAKEWS